MERPLQGGVRNMVASPGTYMTLIGITHAYSLTTFEAAPSAPSFLPRFKPVATGASIGSKVQTIHR
jgi:hypothetical protein